MALRLFWFFFLISYVWAAPDCLATPTGVVVSRTIVPHLTETPVITGSPTVSPTATGSISPTVTQTPKVTGTVTGLPTGSATPKGSPSNTPKATVTGAGTPAKTQTPLGTPSVSSTPLPTNTQQATATFTIRPSVTATPRSTPLPTPTSIIPPPPPPVPTATVIVPQPTETSSSGGGSGSCVQKPSGVRRFDNRNGLPLVDIKINLTSGQIVNGIVPVILDITQAKFCSLNDPRCLTPCDQIDNRKECIDGYEHIKSVIASAKEIIIRDLRNWVVVTKGGQVTNSSPLLKTIAIQWNTKVHPDGEFPVLGEIIFCDGEGSDQALVFIQNAAPTVTPTSTNTSVNTKTPTSTPTSRQATATPTPTFGSGGGIQTPTPTTTPTFSPTPTETPIPEQDDLNKEEIVSLPCAVVEVTFPGVDFGSVGDDQSYVRTENLCFDPETRILRSDNCVAGECEALQSSVSKEMVAVVSTMSASPASALCINMGGDPQIITFNWPGIPEPVEIERCYYEEDSSYYGSKEFYSKKLNHALEKEGIPVTSEPAIEEPTHDSRCETNPSQCEATLACPYGKEQVNCFFVPASGCDAPEEEYRGCKKLKQYSSTVFPSGTQVFSFPDRTFPSGQQLGSGCWARIYVGCRGVQEYPLSYGPERPEGECLNAIGPSGTMQARNKCLNECLYSDEKGCYGLGGPCVSDYPGFGDSCGSCEFNCKRTYEVVP